MVLMTSFEKKTIKFIKKHSGKILIIIVTLVALVLRFKMRNFQSGDFGFFLSDWYERLRIVGLKNAFIGGGIGDYNCPYIILLWVLTKLPLSPLLAIKLVSIFFDFGIAIMSALVVKEILKNKKVEGLKSSFAILATYSIIILLPTVMINSALWAQCDAIYTFFIITSLYLLLKDKYSFSFIMLGCAFAFKLQFIFVLPIYLLIYLKNRNFSFLNFLWIPAMLVVLSLPALICGLPFIHIFKTYILQVGEYKALTLNMFNIYQVFNGDYEYVSLIGYGLCALIFCLLFYYVSNFYKKIEKYQLSTLMLFSVLVCVCFLPSMHERYGYVAVILAVIYFTTNNGSATVFILLEGLSLLGYCSFLFEIPTADYRLLGLIPLGIIVYLSRQIRGYPTSKTALTVAKKKCSG